MNYAIIVVPVALILLTIYWHVSVKHWFTGPKQTIDPDVVAAFDDRICLTDTDLDRLACPGGAVEARRRSCPEG